MNTPSQFLNRIRTRQQWRATMLQHQAALAIEAAKLIAVGQQYEKILDDLPLEQRIALVPFAETVGEFRLALDRFTNTTNRAIQHMLSADAPK